MMYKAAAAAAASLAGSAFRKRIYGRINQNVQRLILTRQYYNSNAN